MMEFPLQIARNQENQGIIISRRRGHPATIFTEQVIDVDKIIDCE
jgi:hypothetical protein